MQTVVDQSLFSALRITAFVVQIKGPTEAKKKEWFHSLVIKLNLSPEQVQVLGKDLIFPPTLEELFRGIKKEDVATLFLWIRGLVKIDGEPSPAESQILDELLQLSKRPQTSSESPSIELGRILIHQHQKIENWQSIANIGESFRNRFHSGFLILPKNFWALKNGPSENHQGVKLFFILGPLVVLCIFTYLVWLLS